MGVPVLLGPIIPSAEILFNCFLTGKRVLSAPEFKNSARFPFPEFSMFFHAECS
jgi:hypothetical protein